MADTTSQEWSKKFWKYYAEAASYSSFTLPDPNKVGDWVEKAGGALAAFIAAAEISAKTGELTIGRVIIHMAANGQYKQVEILSKLLGWTVQVNGRAAALTRGLFSAGMAPTGTVALQGQITVSAAGVAGTLVGAIAAAYVGTVIGCLAYARLRMAGYLDPEKGTLGTTFAQFYGYDPQTEANTDWLFRQAQARSAAARAAARCRVQVPPRVMNRI